MRYVVAFLAATFLSWVYFESSRNGFGYYLGMKAGPVGLLAIAVIFVICFSVAHFREPKSQSLTTSTDVENMVKNRFEGRVFIMSPENYKMKWGKDYREWIDDNDWKRWEAILKRYPKAPLTQNDAIRNEENFWSGWARTYSESDQNGNACLWSHARIRDSYEFNERWILRSYYAATGKVIDPSIEEVVRLMTAKAQADKYIWGDPSSKVKRRQENDLDRVDREIENYTNQGRKSHFEQWGNWFVSHVDDAFNRAQNSVQQKPRSTKLGDGGFATFDEILSRPSGQGQTTRRAQSQTFKD